MKLSTSLLVPFVLSVALVGSCKEATTEPVHQTPDNVLKTLDSLEITFLEVGASYNGMPIYPPATRYAYLVGKLRFRNTSQTRVADSIVVQYGRLFIANNDSVLFNFTPTDAFWYHDSLLCTRLEPGETDSIWFNHQFSPSLAPCQDSVYYDLIVKNNYGDSLALKSATVKFQCSY